MRDDVPAASHRSRRASTAAIVALLFALSASGASAQETGVRGEQGSGEQIVIPAGEVIDGDLHASGGSVRVDGVVTGDLLAIASQVDVVGDVGGDLVAAAAQVNVPGQVDGDVTATAVEVNVSGHVDGDVTAAAGQIDVSGRVDGDTRVAAMQINITGSVGEDLLFGGLQTVLTGSVGGDILGSARYHAVEPETTTPATPAAVSPADRGLAAAQRFVGILIVAALALWLAPRLVDGPARSLRRRPLASAVLGVLALIGFMLLVLILIAGATLLMVALGSVGLGNLGGTVLATVTVVLIVLGGLLFVVLVFGAPAAVGMSLGAVLVRADPRDPTVRRWWPLVFGVLAVVIVTSLPIVGGWTGTIVAILGLGATLLAVRSPGASHDTGAPEPFSRP